GAGSVPTSTLDLADNDLIVTTTARSTVERYLQGARNGGGWDGGGGIGSAAARATANHSTTLGSMSGAEYLSVYGAGATFDTFAVAATDTLVKYTWYGDADFNGEVNFDDYVRADAGFNAGLTGWINGDFDLNGQVDFDDYVLIDLGFNSQN